MARQLVIHLQGGFSLINFFSYFTNLSNLFAAAVLLIDAIKGLSKHEARVDDRIRFASTVNMAVVGIVFAILLRDVDLGALLPWVNFVLHYLMPCVIVLDWLLQPPYKPIRMQHLLLTLVFPALYLAYVLARGSLTGWYPYPFLNPVNTGGYAGVAGYSAGITACFVASGWVLMKLGNRHRPARP